MDYVEIAIQPANLELGLVLSMTKIDTLSQLKHLKVLHFDAVFTFFFFSFVAYASNVSLDNVLKAKHILKIMFNYRLYLSARLTIGGGGGKPQTVAKCV